MNARPATSTRPASASPSSVRSSPARPRRGPLPPPRADHYLSLPDANLMGTTAMKETLANLSEVIDARAMMVLSGAAGNGKSFSANAALRLLAPRNTYRVAFRARPTPRDIRHELFRALALPGEPPARPIEFDTVLKDALARSFHVLLCDEAQWLSREWCGMRGWFAGAVAFPLVAR